MAVDPKSILLVEDNSDDEQLTLRAMKQSDIPNIIRVARDGAEALEALISADGEHKRLPDLVLLDLKLPKVSGLEVLQKLRANKATPPLASGCPHFFRRRSGYRRELQLRRE